MKKIMCVIMMILVFVCSITFSVDATEHIEDKIDELYEYIVDSITIYGLYMPEIVDPVDGEVYIAYTNESIESFEASINEAYELFCSYRYEGNNITLQDIDDRMQQMLKTESELIVARKELKFLIDLCKAENNDDNYYTSAAWDEFTSSLSNAESVLSDETIVDFRVSEVYWVLYNKYSSLCIDNKLAGDINRDAQVTIIDATLIQRKLAKLVDFNVSQYYVSSVSSSYYDINITGATYIQQYLAKLREELNSLAIENLLEVENQLWSRNYKKNYYFYNALFESVFPF